MPRRYQDLKTFHLPFNFRGRSALVVQLWWFVQATLFRGSPQFLYGFRRFLLRVFGASIGKGCIIRPTVTITYPWKVIIGDHSWIGDNATIYSLGNISIGSHTVISQGSYLCGGDHDASVIDFPIRARDISIGSECWLAADVFVAPGVSIGDGSIVGARSSVFRNLPASKICMGSPCVVVRDRVPSFDGGPPEVR